MWSRGSNALHVSRASERGAPDGAVDIATNGEFVAEVPTEGCVEALFDGRDVQVDVNVGGVNVVTNQAVNPPT